MEGAESSDIHGEMLREQDDMLRELAATLGSLRRVAMLIARGRPPEAVFAAVAREALRYLGDGSVSMFRYEPDGTTTLLAQEGIKLAPGVRVGEHKPSGPSAGLTATVLRTGRPARIDDYQEAPGVGPYLLTGLRSAVAMPVHVQGRLWGTIAVGSAERLLPCDTERRMADLTDLVAIAVANAQGRADLIASRARLVTASDDIRRRIERDLHDGVQQRLVAVVYRLRVGMEAVGEPDAVRIEIDDVATELMGVLDDLRELSRGIHPAILSWAACARRCVRWHDARPSPRRWTSVSVAGFRSPSKWAPTTSSRRPSPTRRSTPRPRGSRCPSGRSATSCT